MGDGFRGLDPCVHCGFCLPACPTFLATGDEADSPRGRIVLMRALERGEIPPADAGLRQHLDACLGCRGCEPVCPSGVRYGEGLEAARERLVHHNGLPLSARMTLAVFARRALWSPILTLARWFRATTLPARFAGVSRAGFGMGMLAASGARRSVPRPAPSPHPPARGTVLLFRGCVMDRLFGHVHEATRRTLTANGYRVIDASLPACCGALHLHAGDRETAVSLARRNINALPAEVDYVAVNSAGCGALLKSYDHLVDGSGAGFAVRVRDVAELLALAGPRAGAAIQERVAYDAPCHLQHAQGVHDQVLQVLRAIPGMDLTLVPGYDHCCGSAGIYSLLQPAMSRDVLEAKITAIAESVPAPGLVTTGNPGCLMQIGAGLRARRLPIAVAHPVELLDWSYHAAGLYSG